MPFFTFGNICPELFLKGIKRSKLKLGPQELIEADRKYLFFGNGIQSEDANLDYNRLKDALNAPSIFKK